jgi:hypothetical protein
MVQYALLAQCPFSSMYGIRFPMPTPPPRTHHRLHAAARARRGWPGECMRTSTSTCRRNVGAVVAFVMTTFTLPAILLRSLDERSDTSRRCACFYCGAHRLRYAPSRHPSVSARTQRRTTTMLRRSAGRCRYHETGVCPVVQCIRPHSQAQKTVARLCRLFAQSASTYASKPGALPPSQLEQQAHSARAYR